LDSIVNVYVFLDLAEVLTAKRELMYEELKELGWGKASSAPTLWQRSWSDGFPSFQLTAAARGHVAAAAKTAGVTKYEAVAIVSPEEPDHWKFSAASASFFEAVLARHHG